MKKIAFFIVALFMSVAANAQFEQGKGYLGASLSGFDMSSQSKKFHLGFNAKVGYLFADNLMALGEVGYDKIEGTPYSLSAGAAARYYIIQNGLYLGAGLKYKHAAIDADYLQLPIEVGYCYYLNHFVSIEPAIYFEPCLNKFSDGTRVGLKIGFGFYF